MADRSSERCRVGWVRLQGQSITGLPGAGGLRMETGYVASCSVSHHIAPKQPPVAGLHAIPHLLHEWSVVRHAVGPATREEWLLEPAREQVAILLRPVARTPEVETTSRASIVVEVDTAETDLGPSVCAGACPSLNHHAVVSLAGPTRQYRSPHHPTAFGAGPVPARRVPASTTMLTFTMGLKAHQIGSALLSRVSVANVPAGSPGRHEAALRRSSVNLLRRRLRVDESLAEIGGQLIFGSTKTHAARTVPLPSWVADRLARHMEGLPSEPNALLFTSARGLPVRYSRFRPTVWLPILDRQNLPKTGMHALRHSAAARMISVAWSPKAVQQVLGHGSVA